MGTDNRVRRRSLRPGLLLLISSCLCASILHDVGSLHAVQGKRIPAAGLSNSAGEPLRTKININKISAWYDADGREEINSATVNAGLVYPKGTAAAIFTAGLMWAGMHNDGRGALLRVNGHAYNTGIGPGAMLGIGTGIREDRGADDVRLWRIRRDFATGNLRPDAADINSVSIYDVTDRQIDDVRAQYLTDWLEWPAHKGAPFYDADSDGVYNPVVINTIPELYPLADEPGLVGADQVIWYVANDVDVQNPFGFATPVTGMELQVTVWAFGRLDPFANSVFKRYRLIFKGVSDTPSDATITEMWMSQFSDPDLGGFLEIWSETHALCT